MSLFWKRLFDKNSKIQEPNSLEPAQPVNTKSESQPVLPGNTKHGVEGEAESKAHPPISPKSQAETPVSERKSSLQTIPWRTFSIFISSTFADMQAERDHLKNVVFPKVEEELQQRCIKLEIVDLRWGVDTTSIQQEDEREANVLKVCLDEIRRCRLFLSDCWATHMDRCDTQH
jgi:hypothetical protein